MPIQSRARPLVGRQLRQPQLIEYKKMIDGELFDKVEVLGPKQVSTVQLLDKARHYCANASPENFNLIAVCKTFVLQREDQYDFISHVVLSIV